MAWQNAQQPFVRPLDRLEATMSAALDTSGTVDIITFAEHKQFLGLTLFPRQRLILKIYYHLPLTSGPCWCVRNRQPANETCPFCRGSGIYDELEDVKTLLLAENKYAGAWLPGLCRHHMTGECKRVICESLPKSERRILTDDEIRARLLSHGAHVLLMVCGRRGSKSAVGAIISLYTQYRLLRLPNAASHYGLLPNQEICCANVATDEQQALILFNQQKGMIEASPWFQQQTKDVLVNSVTYPTKNIISRSYHSNSSGVRGPTIACGNLDEFGFLLPKAAEKMWTALKPASVTFGADARMVIGTSPGIREGTTWELADGAMSGVSQHILYFQLATWEMNPAVTRETHDIVASYKMDRNGAEVEYGAQWADAVAIFIPEEAVDQCANKALSFQTHGVKGVDYFIHCDLAARRDSVGLVISHWDSISHMVIQDRIEEFDPRSNTSAIVNSLHEIDLQALFEYIVDLRRNKGFRFRFMSFDHFNSLWIVQELRREFGDVEGDWIQDIPTTEAFNRLVYGSFRSLLVQHGIEYYPHVTFMQQVKQLWQVIKTNGKWKVQAPPGKKDDLADASAVSAHICMSMSIKRRSGLEVVNGEPVTPQQRSTAEIAAAERRKHHRNCTKQACYYECEVHIAERNRRTALRRNQL